MSFNLFENPEEYDTSYRLPTLSPYHAYNLQNQSWGIPRKNKDGIIVDPVVEYAAAIGVYPSNSEVVWTGLQFQPVENGNDPYERLFTNLYVEKLGSDAVAAKGYFIIDLLRRGQSRAEAYSANKSKYIDLLSPALETRADLTPGGASVVQEFAGRVFYAGFNGEVIGGDIRSPNLSNYILFSQLVRNKKDFVKCYQEGDPTSRENSDVVDTDGGFVRISGAEKILDLKNLGNALVVIASNGIWSVVGGSDFGFTATNYKVEKISSYGAINQDSVVEDSGQVYYWGEDGIFIIGRDQFGALVVTSLTDKTIQKLYQAIPNTVKRTALGSYDSVNRVIRWLYKTIGDRFTEDSITYELVLNTVIGAFYKNKLYNPPDNSAEIVSMFSSVQFSNNQFFDFIYDGDDQVFVGTDAVEIVGSGLTSPFQSTRYLTFVKDGATLKFTFGYYRDIEFIDFPELSGVDAKAYLLTGSTVVTDSSVDKQIPYLTMHMYRTETGVDENGIPDNPSGCLVRSQWNFANTINSNKWSSLFQAYRYRKPQLITGPSDTYDTGFEVVTTKNKLRGRGKSFALYMETEPLKDCRIIGWNLAINGNPVT